VLQSGRPDDKALLFKLASVGFVVARAGVMPAGGIWVDKFDFARAVEITDADPSLRRLSEDERSAAWETATTVPRVYAPDCTIAVPLQADAYDLLPWSRVTTQCRRPAFVASAKSDEIMLRADEATPQSAVGTTANRWDAYYFGNRNVRPAVRNNAVFRRLGATMRFDIHRAGVYDVYVRLETGSGLAPVAFAVDGQAPVCVDPRTPSTRTEDMVALRRTFLTAGVHAVRLSGCRHLNSRKAPFQVLGIDVVPGTAVRASDAPSPIESVVRKPSAFIVTVRGGHPTDVVLNDAYDERWVARQNGTTLPHSLVNGYANAWQVQRPADGPIAIEFLPQRNSVAGFTLTLIVFAGLIAFAGWPRSGWQWRRAA
jgi:hypothetical protein